MNVLVQIIVSLIAVCLVLMFLVLWAFPAIKLRIMAFLGRKLHKGLIRVVGHDYKVRTYLRKFEPKMEVGRNTYALNDRLVMHEEGVPIIHYYEGDTEPIDMTKQDKDLHDPEMFSDLLIKAKLAGAEEALKDQKIMMYCCIGAAAAAGVAAAISFGLQNDMKVLMQMIAAIS